MKATLTKFLLLPASIGGGLLSLSVAAPMLLTSCSNSKTESNKIDASQTIKEQKIYTQKTNTIVYNFTTTQTNLKTETLTALAQIDNVSDITINPKVYVEVENKNIKATVSYNAVNVNKFNDQVKFHITFTNTDPTNTWAQTINDLSITYSSPFFDKTLETESYLFVGQTEAQNAKRRISINYDKSITNLSVEVKHTAGNIRLKTPSLILQEENNNAIAEIPYTSDEASVGEKIGIEITFSGTLNGQKYSQAYILILEAAENIHLLEKKTSIQSGGEFAWFYAQLALPLGSGESSEDIEVKIEQTTTSTEPMYIELYGVELDQKQDYISFILNIKDGFITPNGKAKFNMTVTKKDHSATSAEPKENGTPGWTQTFKNIEINFIGDYFKDMSFSESEMAIWTCSYDNPKTELGIILDRTSSKLDVRNYNWEIDFKLVSKPETLQTPQYWTQLFRLSKLDSSTSWDIIWFTINRRDYSPTYPTDWQNYIDHHGSVTTTWDVIFTSTKKIKSEGGITQYQKQVINIQNAIKIIFK